MTQFLDLSQPIESGMTFFPGDPEPRIEAVPLAAPWRVSQLHLGTHTGTHIDAAAHFLPQGKAISDYPPERFLLSGIVVAVEGSTDDEAIQEEALAPSLSLLPPGGALLIRTGWDRHWKTERYLRHPYLSAEAAQLLARAGLSLVGIDALNVDSTVQGTEHAHAALLGNDILIVENLTRLNLLTSGIVYQFAFLPLPLLGLDGSPVRAIAWRQSSV